MARSKEAKKLGIRMGAPYFQIESLCSEKNVVVFSSNYELYGDLSARMMGTIASVVGRREPYSIDECFADLSELEVPHPALSILAFQIKDKILKDVGIPPCVGIAPTKTLAKYCNHLAKTHPPS